MVYFFLRGPGDASVLVLNMYKFSEVISSKEYIQLSGEGGGEIMQNKKYVHTFKADAVRCASLLSEIWHSHDHFQDTDSSSIHILDPFSLLLPPN